MTIKEAIQILLEQSRCVSSTCDKCNGGTCRKEIEEARRLVKIYLADAEEPKPNIFNVVWDEFKAKEKKDAMAKEASQGGGATGSEPKCATRPLVLDGVVCMYETPSKDEMDKFWHDVLTSNGDVD